MTGRKELAAQRAAEMLANPERRMDAYYYGFDPTGVAEIDAILSAVAHAGKASHHTDCWNDDDYSGTSLADVIQAAANQAAALRQEPSVEAVAAVIHPHAFLSKSTLAWVEPARTAARQKAQAISALYRGTS